VDQQQRLRSVIRAISVELFSVRRLSALCQTWLARTSYQCGSAGPGGTRPTGRGRDIAADYGQQSSCLVPVHIIGYRSRNSYDDNKCQFSSASVVCGVGRQHQQTGDGVERLESTLHDV